MTIESVDDWLGTHQVVQEHMGASLGRYVNFGVLGHFDDFGDAVRVAVWGRQKIWSHLHQPDEIGLLLAKFHDKFNFLIAMGAFIKAGNLDEVFALGQ